MNPLEHPGSWQRPRDLCGPWPAERQQVTFPTPAPLYPTPPMATQRGWHRGRHQWRSYDWLKGMDS